MTLLRGDARPPDGEPGDVAEGRGGRDKVESNARLTASTAVVLFVLLAAEGVTILQIRPLLSPHVFIGMVLIPPVLVKIGSTTYRFVRYYRHDPDYRRKGPPPALLRLLGPFLVVCTVVLFASGVALLVTGPAWRQRLLFLHRASFVLWFGAMVIHVLGHLADTARIAPRDWMRRTRRDVAGAGARQWTIVASMAVGVLLGIALLGRVGPWLAADHLLRVGAHRDTAQTALPPPAPPTTNGSKTSSPPTTGSRSAPTTIGSVAPSSIPPGSTSTAVPTPVSTAPVASHKRHHVAKKHKH